MRPDRVIHIDCHVKHLFVLWGDVLGSRTCLALSDLVSLSFAIKVHSGTSEVDHPAASTKSPLDRFYFSTYCPLVNDEPTSSHRDHFEAEASCPPNLPLSKIV